MKILAATINCDRKKYFLPIALQTLTELKQQYSQEISQLYLNYEDSGGLLSFGALVPEIEIIRKYQSEHGLDYDVWRVSNSSYQEPPQYDQDTARLFPIVTARNMAMQYATARDFTHLLFIDADVVPDHAGVAHLLAMAQSGVKLCGGLVPGRGSHSHAQYVFGIRSETSEFYRCAHGTCGYMLIAREVFEVLRFRTGGHPSPEHRHVFLSEDPAFCADAEILLKTGDFIISKRATAQHLDEPAKPLTNTEAVNNYKVAW